MKKSLIVIVFVIVALILANATTGYLLWESNKQVQKLTAYCCESPLEKVKSLMIGSGMAAANEDWGPDEYYDDGSYCDGFLSGSLSHTTFEADAAVVWCSPKYATYVYDAYSYFGSGGDSDYEIKSFDRKTMKEFNLKRIFPKGPVRDKLFRRVAEEISLRRWISRDNDYYSRVKDNLPFPTVSRNKLPPPIPEIISEESVQEIHKTLTPEKLKSFCLYRDGWHFYVDGEYSIYSHGGMEIIIEHIPGEVLP